MRVKWTEVFFPAHIEDYPDAGDYVPPATQYAGEVIGTVRSWGETKLVVMLDSGSTREIAANLVERAS